MRGLNSASSGSKTGCRRSANASPRVVASIISSRQLTDAEAHEALLQATVRITVRIVMRMVVCLFAESRALLPVNEPIVAATTSGRRIAINASRLAFAHRRFAPEWLKLAHEFPAVFGFDPLAPSVSQQGPVTAWKHWWAVTEADRLRLRVEIDALCTDLYGLDPDDFDCIVRDAPKDPKGFYRVDRQLPFRERLTGLSAAAFRALKNGKWSGETAGQLSNDQFFDLLGIPELTSPTAAKSKGLAAPLIQKRNGCHAWRPEHFPEEDPRHGWTWQDCRQDAITLLGSEEALDQYIAQTVDGSSSLVSGNENPTSNDQRPTTTDQDRPLRRPPPHRPLRQRNPPQEETEEKMKNPPDWWEWELEISSHCLKRMTERGFNEAELRAMMEDATSVEYQDHGTFIVQTSHESVRWEVIVIPEHDKEVTIVVTAYPDS